MESAPVAPVQALEDDPPAPQVWYQDRWLVGLMLTAALLGLIYGAGMILGKGADEPRHMAYVRLLLDEHCLPFLEPDPNSPGRMREHAGAHTLHPPLYYLLLLPFYAATRGLGERAAWHITRLVSLALCLAALPLIYQIAQRAGRGTPIFARLAVAQVALLPIYGMTAGTINNDSATLLAVTLFLWLLSVPYAADRTLKSACVLGLCFGCGGLCKATALLCDGAALVVYLLTQDGWRAGLTSLRAWARLGIALLGLAVVAGPWYGRNFHLYHKLTPIDPGYSPSALHWLPSLDMGVLTVIMHPNFSPLFGQANWSIFYTIWSQKDWIPDTLRPLFYYGLAAYSVLALLGLLAHKLRRGRDTRNQAQPEADAEMMGERGARVAAWSSFAAFAINWLACLAIALFVHWGWAEGGRYLLPALCGLSLLLARGWSGLVGAQRLSAVLYGWCFSLIGLNCVTIYWLLHYLNPTFGNS